MRMVSALKDRLADLTMSLALWALVRLHERINRYTLHFFPPLHYEQDFAKEPYTITELRAHREYDAARMLPREALICLLRDIDGGRRTVERLAILYALENGNSGFVCAGMRTYYELGGFIARHLSDVYR